LAGYGYQSILYLSLSSRSFAGRNFALQASRGFEGGDNFANSKKLVLLHLFLFHALKLLFLIKNSKTDWKEKEKKIVFFLLAEPCKRRVKIIIFCHFVRLDSLFSWART
jgi:hypothetical protein